MRGFIEVDVEEGCLLRELFKSEFIAAVFNSDFLSSFGVFEGAVFFDEWNVVKMGRLSEMTLFKKL